MTLCPRILINVSKIIDNYHVIKKRCDRAGIQLTTVVKGLAGDVFVLKMLVESGVDSIGDSRLENLALFNKFPKLNKMMLRLPSLSRIPEMLEYADLSLNTEIETLKAIDEANRFNSKPHEIMLMVDLGDRREGVLTDNLNNLAEQCRLFRNLRISGIGANFSCFAGVKPSRNKLIELISLAKMLRETINLPIKIISGGNSSSLSMLYDNAIPEGINHLRIGEGILLGRETLGGTNLPDLASDAFLLEAEVLQVQWKPALADGEIGYDAFGRLPQIPEIESGIRMLLNVGHQDTPLQGLTPLDRDFRVLGGSSDYMVMASHKKVRVGDIIQFSPDYWSVLALMTSRYVKKEYRV